MVNMAGYEPLVDTAALAVWLGVSPATIRSWAHRGRLERRGRDGKRVLYSVAQAATLIKAPENGNA